MQVVVLTICRWITVAALVVAVAPSGAQQQHTLSPDVFATISDDRYQQVMHIGPGNSPGSIRVLSRRNLQEFDTSGRRLRVVTYPDELWLPFPTRFTADGPERIVGLKSGFFRSWVDVLDSSAKRISRLKSWQDGFVETADVIGDSAKEVLVRYRDGVAVMNETGRQLAFVKSPRYLYHFRTIAVPGLPKRAIAMWMWLDAKHGTDIAVLNADGSVVSAWHENPSDRFSVFSLGNEQERLWSAVADRFWERAATGEVLRTYMVAGMGNFRYIHGGVLAGGKQVFVGSAGGYQAGVLVCVLDASGQLLARDQLPGRAWAFYVPDRDGTVFYVGSGELVLRYDVASLTSSGPP